MHGVLKYLACAVPLFAGLAFCQAKAPNPTFSCAALNGAKFSDVVSIRAEEVTNGKVQPPSGAAITDLPEFCRAIIVASPAKDSHINIELWIPAKDWNGKFLGTGNGGGGGKIYYPPLRAGVRRGFATANTDLGTFPNADNAVNNPEAWIDFGYRATHVMTVISKAVIEAFFDKAPQRSYFWGSSTGGQQAMSEAQRYPEDYDGIIAGSAAINRTHLHSYFVWNFQALNKVAGKSQLSAEDIAQLDRAVVRACAGKDGGAPTDDFLTDPRLCHFDPAALPLCSNDSAKGCVTTQQFDALKRLYAGPVNPQTGERIYAPIPPGSEASNLGLTYQETPSTAKALLYPFLWAFGKDFDEAKFDFSSDDNALDEKLAATLNANNPDLRAFRARGGKLIMYTGTADPVVPYPDEVDYYERVIHFMQMHPQKDAPKDPLVATHNFFRLYIVPGMGHGAGGPGVGNFGQLIQITDDDVLYALERWVEQGVVPGEFPGVAWNEGVSSKGVRLRRNVCAYPNLPDYIGGDPLQAASFRCKPHARGGVATAADRYLR